jgi:hypothetical protein
VSCNNNSTPTDITWNNAPNWENPTSGTHSNVTVTAKCNGYTGNLSANCNGTLVVSGVTTIPVGGSDPVTEITQVNNRSFNISNGNCVNITINWDNQYYSPDVAFQCDQSGSYFKLKTPQGGDYTTAMQVAAPPGLIISGIK